ncbi:MAG: hypothetical protein IPM24_07480 [Bryobacterales bacterium]|jgi:uncharacterized membrane protein|nr:hypothetical protein [Bryobacterales bacterium]
MPYCSHCGSKVGERDIYCAHCGGMQPEPPATPVADAFSPRTAAILCYVPFFGWIASIFVLVSDKFRHDFTVRFHAFQGLYLFVAWLLIHQVVAPVFQMMSRGAPIGRIFELAVLAVWIFMLFKTSQDQRYSLPILGELAEKSAAEQSK